MHEFGIAQGLLEIVLTKTHENSATRVDSIKLEVGVLSGIEEEALKFAFTALSEGTEAEKADLVIDTISLKCHCATCNRLFDCDPVAYRCPDCGTPSSELIKGNEMKLVSMEVT